MPDEPMETDLQTRRDGQVFERDIWAGRADQPRPAPTYHVNQDAYTPPPMRGTVAGFYVLLGLLCLVLIGAGSLYMIHEFADQQSSAMAPQSELAAPIPDSSMPTYEEVPSEAEAPTAAPDPSAHHAEEATPEATPSPIASAPTASAPAEQPPPSDSTLTPTTAPPPASPAATPATPATGGGGTAPPPPPADGGNAFTPNGVTVNGATPSPGGPATPAPAGGTASGAASGTGAAPAAGSGGGAEGGGTPPPAGTAP